MNQVNARANLQKGYAIEPTPFFRHTKNSFSKKEPPKQAFSTNQSIQFISNDPHVSSRAKSSFCIAIVVGVEIAIV